MSLALLLPWFPIVLAVGVGGRLLGRGRGFALGFVCALFWIVLIQASAGVGLWRDSWAVTTIVIGAFAIFIMGGWSAGGPIEQPVSGRAPTNARTDQIVNPPGLAGFDDASYDNTDSAFRRFGAVIDRFDDWIEQHRGDGDPWSDFDDFIRATLYECVQATHVKSFRLCADGQELEALRDAERFVEVPRRSARGGIVGHVLTTARSYLAGDAAQGQLVATLADESEETLAWCFPITQGTRRLGAVTAGQLGLAPDRSPALFAATERLIAQFWCTLVEAIRGRTAGEVDPISGLLTRQAFLHTSELALTDSYDQGEPVAVVAFAIEGLRQLNDSGRWGIADELVGEVGRTLRQKVRMDDRLGRFDGSRFVWLLRRVDSQLAALIAKQVMLRLTRLCDDENRWRTSVKVRCGLCGVGLERPSLTALVSKAQSQLRRARLEGIAIATDLSAGLNSGSEPPEKENARATANSASVAETAP